MFSYHLCFLQILSTLHKDAIDVVACYLSPPGRMQSLQGANRSPVDTAAHIGTIDRRVSDNHGPLSSWLEWMKLQTYRALKLQNYSHPGSHWLRLLGWGNAPSLRKQHDVQGVTQKAGSHVWPGAHQRLALWLPSQHFPVPSPGRVPGLCSEHGLFSAPTKPWQRDTQGLQPDVASLPVANCSLQCLESRADSRRKHVAGQRFLRWQSLLGMRAR